MFNRRTAAFAIGLFFIAASAGPRPAAADDALARSKRAARSSSA
jgi:hypothetical protein